MPYLTIRANFYGQAEPNYRKALSLKTLDLKIWGQEEKLDIFCKKNDFLSNPTINNFVNFFIIEIFTWYYILNVFQYMSKRVKQKASSLYQGSAATDAS